MNKTMPKLALGAWSWGTGAAGGDQVFGNNLSKDRLQPVFNKALELGLNLWDTAAVYGEGSSEKILGHFIKNINQEDIIISTKFTPQIASDSANAMQEMIDGSKLRLNVETIDIYWIHNPMDVEKWTPQLIPLLKSGQVSSVGVSNHNLSEIKRVNEILSKEGYHISAVQNHFSLLHRSSEKAGILDYCKQRNITFYAYMVLEQGALTGKYDTQHPFLMNTGRGESYNPILDKLENINIALKDIGKKYNASPAQVAIAWAISKGTLPIVGVTKVNQVEEAKQTLKIKLTEDEVKYLEKIADITQVRTLREWEKDME